MTAAAKDLMAVNEARLEVLRLMNEYCYRIDRGDLEGFAGLFDCGSFGIIGDPAGPISGRKAMLNMLQNVTLYDGKPHTKHVMSNVQIDIAASGTEAKAESYIIVFQALPPDFPMQAIFGGHYFDRFSKKGQDWMFASREISPDLIGDLSRHRADMA
jgi:SnoaL-like domain